MSQEEITMIYKEILENKYGNQISVTYIDIEDKNLMDKYPEARDYLKTKRVSSLPLIAINSIPVFLGSLSYNFIVDELEKKGIKPVG